MCVCKLCFIVYFSGWRKTSWATLVFGKITFLGLKPARRRAMTLSRETIEGLKMTGQSE